MNSEQMSIEDIANVTDTSQKTIRAYLRREHARSAERKGSRWGDAKHGFVLSKTLTKELLERYSESESESDSE
jgi:hypothetical protein